MNLRELAKLRLENQLVRRSDVDDPADVVRWMGAVQAQDYLYSLWGVGLRTRDATQVRVERAIADRTIVRTWPMRGTIHFVPAEDASWMTDLLAPRAVSSAGSIYRKAGLDDATFARAADVLAKEMTGRRLTRAELYAVLDGAGLRATQTTPVGSRGMHIIVNLAQTGLLCFGPRRGRQPTFVLLEEWVPEPRRLQRDEALAELTLRYFQSHGPATDYDLAWWTGLTVSDARRAIDTASSKLGHVTLEEVVYRFIEPMPPEGHESSNPDLFLLPYLDEFTVGYKDRRLLVDAEHRSAAMAASRYNLLDPVIVAGGRIVGIWKRTIGRGAVTIETEFFPQSHTFDAHLADASQRFAAFVGLPAG